MDFDDLKNPELQEKLRACETGEELVRLVKENGLELSAEQLESISGGIDWNCPGLCFSYHPNGR